MDKKIEDYLHLYLGCEISHLDSPQFFKLQGVSKENVVLKYPDTIVPYGFKINDPKLKLILRPLSDMTEEEAIEVTKPVTLYPESHSYETFRNTFGRICVSWGDSRTQKYVPQSEAYFLPEQTLYLLKQGFDLFGLIESGLAISKVEVSNPLKTQDEK